MTVKVKDTGFDALMKVAKELNRPRSMSVGVHPSANGQGRNGVSVVDYASYNEFGTRFIPERSFLRAWFDEAKPRLDDLITQVTRDALEGKRPYEQGLKRLGVQCVGEIQERIASNIPPPDKPHTIARKGSDTTLIDTGVLRSSITFEIKDVGEG